MASRDGGSGGQAGRGGGLVIHPLDVHEIDCTPCEQGCCGRRRIAIPEDLYQRLLMVKRAMEEANGQAHRNLPCIQPVRGCNLHCTRQSPEEANQH